MPVARRHSAKHRIVITGPPGSGKAPLVRELEAAEEFGKRVRQVYVGLGYSIVDVPCDAVVARARFILGTLGLVGSGSVAAR